MSSLPARLPPLCNGFVMFCTVKWQDERCKFQPLTHLSVSHLKFLCQSWVVISLNLLVHVIMCECPGGLLAWLLNAPQIITIMRRPVVPRSGYVHRSYSSCRSYEGLLVEEISNKYANYAVHH
jgi:hypothetical protein